MDSEDDIRTILARTAGGANGASGPPMRLEAADVIDRGGRIRRRRKRWAVAGSSAATAVVLAVAGFTAGHRAAPDPIQPANPGLSTIGTTTPAPPPEATPAPAVSEPPGSEPTGRDQPAVPTRVAIPTTTVRKTGRTSPPPQIPTATTRTAPAEPSATSAPR